MQGEVLLEVKELRTWFPIRQGIIRRKTGDIKAVDGVSLRILKGETFGLVGLREINTRPQHPAADRTDRRGNPV